jgi:glycosyltransferase involved in cell wall biosynthesis
VNVIALIPAYNEAARIGATVRAVRTIKGVSTVLVIDDGSADETTALAREAGAEVLALVRNAGKGAALAAGLEHIRADVDVVMLLDADLEESAAQAVTLLEPVISGEADMTIATFPRPAGKAGFGLVMRLARWGIRRLGGDFDARAPVSGQRALNRRAIETVLPIAAGYGVEVALTIRALRAGLRLAEVPTTMRHAATSRDLAGFVHRGRQFVDVAGALLRIALRG